MPWNTDVLCLDLVLIAQVSSLWKKKNLVSHTFIWALYYMYVVL